eukprot:3614827-Prymnesium_polylepis.2
MHAARLIGPGEGVHVDDVSDTALVGYLPQQVDVRRQNLKRVGNPTHARVEPTRVARPFVASPTDTAAEIMLGSETSFVVGHRIPFDFPVPLSAVIFSKAVPTPEQRHPIGEQIALVGPDIHEHGSVRREAGHALEPPY